MAAAARRSISDRKWKPNHKRFEPLWRHKGLLVPQKQPKLRRLWLNAGAGVPLRPTGRDEVLSDDLVHHPTQDGRVFRMLTRINEFTCERLEIDVACRRTSQEMQNDSGTCLSGRPYRTTSAGIMSGPGRDPDWFASS